jgi:hypothetical protein
MSQVTEREPIQSNRLGTCLLPQCGRLFAVCGPCDRGRRYCSDVCSRSSRRAKQRLAGARYQATEQGRRKHAERQARYQESRRVTHQSGRPSPEIHAITHVDEKSVPAQAPSRPLRTSTSHDPQSHRHRYGEVKPPCCSLCGKDSTFLRTGFVAMARHFQRKERRSGVGGLRVGGLRRTSVSMGDGQANPAAIRLPTQSPLAKSFRG